MKFHKIKTLRKVALPVLGKFSFDFRASHPWIGGTQYRLNSFKHKGYWWHRGRRERETMILFRHLVQPGGVVLEVGGHIGFISLYFGELVGSDGLVFAFEPGNDNLRYLRENVSSYNRKTGEERVTIVENAVSDRSGVEEFFEENLTGQNNSLVKDFRGLENNKRWAFVSSDTVKREVKTLALDDWFFENKDQFVKKENQIFVKIDVEGAELKVLLGGGEFFQQIKPLMMCEIQADREAIFKWAGIHGYRLFDPSRNEKTSWQELNGNIFFIPDHSSLLDSVNWKFAS